jgi:hypothetical protein
MRNAYNILEGKPEVKKPLKRPEIVCEGAMWPSDWLL